MRRWSDVPRKPKAPILTPLPPKVRVSHGSYLYDLGRDADGKRRWRKLCRVDEGVHALYKALADATSPKVRTLGDLFHRFIAKKLPTLAPRTQADYMSYLNGNLRTVFAGSDPHDVTSGHIAQYLQRRLEVGGGVVANREVACLSSVYNYGMRLGLCDFNPCRGVRRNPQPPRTRYIEDSEFLKAFDAAPEEFKDFMAALYLTGLRQGDIRRMKRTQITPQGIRIEQEKTGKVVIVEMSEALRYFIIRAQTRAPQSPYVFTNSHGQPWGQWAIQSQVRRLKGKIGHDWTLHDIRAKAESDHSVGLGLLPLYKRASRIKPVR